MNVDKMRRASHRAIWREEQRRVAGVFRRMAEDVRNPKPVLTPEQHERLVADLMRATERVGARIYASLPPQWQPRRP